MASLGQCIWAIRESPPLLLSCQDTYVCWPFSLISTSCLHPCSLGLLNSGEPWSQPLLPGKAKQGNRYSSTIVASYSCCRRLPEGFRDAWDRMPLSSSGPSSAPPLPSGKVSLVPKVVPFPSIIGVGVGGKLQRVSASFRSSIAHWGRSEQGLRLPQML